MNEDGRMARLDDLIKFSKQHKIKIASIADLIAYRLKNERLVYKYYSKNLILRKTQKIQLDIYRNKLNNYESFVLKKGNFLKNKATHVRVLSKKINRSNLLENKEIKKILKFFLNIKLLF